MTLKDTIKNYAYQLGADLVGFGDIQRCKNAPPMMSPQGLYPDARSVIVMALRHPDACIELGGENHPQEIGPYSIQYLMNSRLDEMSYRMATFIERQGNGAIGIASSNIWRYNHYKQLKAVFAPDVSHIYMAVVAGLAELGFNGLAITPQYGARNRFVTVITDAKLDPDPLIAPGTVCDQCMLCQKHCPTQALSKEIDGDKELEIGEYTYRFPNKNLWRCAWGEHFDLDLDLEIPDVVDEKIILEQVAIHGVRGGEMGQCLKFCLPKALRTFDRDYSRTPMRRYTNENDNTVQSQTAVDRVLANALCNGADEAIVLPVHDLLQEGIDLQAILPDAQTAITLVVKSPHVDNTEFKFGAQYQLDSLCYDLTRELENLGHRSIMTMQRDPQPHEDKRGTNPTSRILTYIKDFDGQSVLANTVITRKILAPHHRKSSATRKTLDHGDTSLDITSFLTEQARLLGADLVAVAPVSRINELVSQIRPVFESDHVLDARDQSIRFKPWKPEITQSITKVRTPADCLPTAKSVLVFGLRLHKQVVKQAAKPPAEAVGPYSFDTYITNWLGSVIGYRLVKELEKLGHAATITFDLTGTASLTASPRGPQPDLFANRFAGLAAGLGSMTVSGHLATPQFGIRQRLVAIVTDAPLTASPMPQTNDQTDPCSGCDKPCIDTCPSKAITLERIELTCEGQKFALNRIDRKRCDWVKRYALMGESGFKYVGSTVDVSPPPKITADSLANALQIHDPIKKIRPVVAEPCVINCPL